MANKTFKLFADKMGGVQASNYIGTEGEIFYDPTTTTLRISDGASAGGIEYALGTGGSTGDITFNGVKIQGSGTASGDGQGYATLELVPDNDLYNSNQYIVVDPTSGEPGHIHLRAGGTQDQSSADLYIGGELTCVRVSDTSDSVTIRTTNIGDPNITMNWIFDNQGYLYLPGIGNNRIGESEPGLVLTSDYSIVLQSNNSGNINEIKEWYFGADGATTFPTLTVPISDNATPTGTGQTLKFGASTQQAIIYGPESTESNISAERIIIQGAPGYTGTNGEGGDVYLWAGPGGDVDGGGGDIKVRAGEGRGNGNGGYLNFQAGDTATSYGGYINIESGQSDIAGNGGRIDIRARSGGDINLYTSLTGNIILNSEGGAWSFGTDGALTLPDGVSVIRALDPASSGGINGISIAGKDRAFISIGDNATYSYPWQFRASGAGSSESTALPTIRLPGGGWLQEDLTNIQSNLKPMQLGSQGAFTLTVKNNANFPDPAVDYNWVFGTDGSLTLPSGNTTIGNLFDSDAIISAPNTVFGVVSQGITGSGVLQWLDSIIDPMTSAGIGVNSPYASSTGSVQIYTGIVGPTPQNAWTFDPDGATTFPGAIVKSTVAKAPLTAGLMTAIITSPNSDPAWVDGTYSVTWTGGGSADIIITASAFDSIANVVYGTGTWEIGDVIGSFNVGGIGNILLIVDSINAIAPLDLTKSINKLTAGEYSLADGVEGQIMYMVPRNGITSASSVTVVVANGRAGDFTGQDALLSPFRLFNGTDYIDSTGMCTLIFTDGAWQQQGGAWD